MNATHKGKSTSPKNSLLIGILIFFLGIWGLVSWFGVGTSPALDRIFPADTGVFAQISLSSHSAQKLQQLFPEANVVNVLNQTFGQQFGLTLTEESLSWVGKRLGIAFSEKGDITLAVQFRNRSRAEAFLEQFRLEGESFTREKISGGAELWTPSFSSSLAFGFFKGYVFFSSSEENLRKTFLSSEKLADTDLYQDVRKDFSSSSALFAFVKTQDGLPWLSPERFAAQKPLIDAVSKTLPALGISAEIEKEGLKMQAKVVTTEGVFQKRDIERDAEQILPELAQFAPRDVLFFMNGYDLYAKYQHTKEFLAEFHPQFSVIFDGILRGVTRELFGEKFDFERDALSKMHGQYAVILDFHDPLSPFLYLTIVTGFGGADQEGNVSELNQAIDFAQGQFSPELREVKLPDGTVREELVAAEKGSIPIVKREVEGQSYFTVQSPSNASSQFSYGFAQGYLIFSTQEQGVKSVLSALRGDSLAQNEDFRESVLFLFSPSESYGFFNVSKWASAFEILSETSEYSAWGQFFHSSSRNLTFSRKVFPNEIFWTAMLFAR